MTASLRQQRSTHRSLANGVRRGMYEEEAAGICPFPFPLPAKFSALGTFFVVRKLTQKCKNLG